MTAAAAGSRTRSERTADSRLLILDAAVACLVEDGYAGASTLAVQARAGVSRGRLLHHFPSRAELLVAAAGHLSTTLLAEVRSRAAAVMADQPTGRERIDRAIELMWATFQEPPFWAAMELWTAARTDPDLRAALRSRGTPAADGDPRGGRRDLGPGDRRRAALRRALPAAVHQHARGGDRLRVRGPAARDRPARGALEAAGHRMLTALRHGRNRPG